MDELSRGVTYWEGTGAYTGDSSHILLTMISKYEEPHLREIIERIDPNAFVILSEGSRVMGNFQKRFTD